MVAVLPMLTPIPLLLPVAVVLVMAAVPSLKIAGIGGSAHGAARDGNHWVYRVAIGEVIETPVIAVRRAVGNGRCPVVIDANEAFGDGEAAESGAHAIRHLENAERAFCVAGLRLSANWRRGR